MTCVQTWTDSLALIPAHEQRDQLFEFIPIYGMLNIEFISLYKNVDSLRYYIEVCVLVYLRA